MTQLTRIPVLGGHLDLNVLEDAGGVDVDGGDGGQGGEHLLGAHLGLLDGVGPQVTAG